jgi:hypothetical protein
MDKEIADFLKIPIPPATPPTPQTTSIAKKREELELKKLEIEIAKLEKPDTNIDYFQKMLELQGTHFKQLLEMQKQHSGLMLEIEKLKFGEGSDEMAWLEMLEPYLPKIFGTQQQPDAWGNTNNPYQYPDMTRAHIPLPAVVPIEAKSGGVDEQNSYLLSDELSSKTPPPIFTADEIITLIKSGEMTEEEAYISFHATDLAEIYKAPLRDKAAFHIQFEKVKHG